MKLTKKPWLFLNKGVLIEYVENVFYKFIESVEIQNHLKLNQNFSKPLITS